jgi:hypothetical protein
LIIVILSKGQAIYSIIKKQDSAQIMNELLLLEVENNEGSKKGFYRVVHDEQNGMESDRIRLFSTCPIPVITICEPGRIKHTTRNQ